MLINFKGTDNFVLCIKVEPYKMETKVKFGIVYLTLVNNLQLYLATYAEGKLDSFLKVNV